MAIIFSDGYTDKENNVFYRTGKNLRTVNSKLTVASATSTIGDIYVLSPSLTLNSKIHRIMTPAGVTAITGFSDNDLGFYYLKNDVLTAIDADVLVDALDLSSNVANIDLLSNNAALDKSLTIGELISKGSDAGYADGIFLCMTVNSAATADGVVDLDIKIEESTAN